MPIWDDLSTIEQRVRIADLIGRWWRIDILVVADTIVSLGPEHHPNNMNEDYFGMAHLLGVLEGVGRVVKAHRQSDPLGAANVIENFNFAAHDLSQYDQIWLLGYGSGVLPTDQQAAIARFMNAGGGVFATGDHASLGSMLAGALPRVRSMRRWASPPPPLGPTRVDTTRPDLNDVVVFENQSDDIPQKMRLRFYEWRKSGYTRQVYPHPLLCSRWGPIDHFPDHMHEGEVVVPDDLEAVMTLGGETFEEYPKDRNGVRVSPEIVAWGYTTGRASPEVMGDVHVGDPGVANARWTGAVGAYDGRRCGVGRVVVDSTWHHFFDINLIGDNAANRPGVTDPRAPIWRKGFTYSPEGQAVLERFDQYIRNIVRWLSPGIGIVGGLDGLVVQTAMTHHVREVLETTKLSPAALGAYAWPYALRLAPPCTIMQFVFPPIYEVVDIPIPPWERPPGPDPDMDEPVWMISPRELAEAALGGALLAFAELEGVEALEDGRGAGQLRRGAQAAVAGLVEEELARAQISLERLGEIHRRLRIQAA